MIESINNNGGGGGGVQTVVAGTGISIDNTDPENPIVTNTVTDTDDKVRVSVNDTTAGYLNGKLVAGTGIGLTENNNGLNETLTVAVSNLDASAITTGTVATARLGTGTANSTTYLAGDQTYKAAVTSVNGSTGAVTVAAGDTTYTVTTADAENTTSTITLAQFTVPANTWANGEQIIMQVFTTADNASGSTANITLTVGGTTITDVQNPNKSYSSGFGVKNNLATLRFLRVGNGVYMYRFNSANNTMWYDGLMPPFWGGGAGANPELDTAVTFTSDITIYYKIQFSLANASLYCRTEYARAWKISAGTV